MAYGSGPVATILVDDILREIYLYVALREPPYHPSPPKGSDSSSTHSCYNGPWLGWIRLTHISRQFRHVGLHISELWAEIVCVYESSHAVETILQRTSHRPLTIDIDHKDLTKRRYEIATGVINRVSSLSWLPVQGDVYLGHWATLLSGKTLPLLRSLDVRSAFEQPEDRLGPREPLVAPSLEDYAVNFDIPIEAPRLREIFYDGTTRISLQRLLIRLSGFANLVILYLGTVPTEDSTEPSPVNSVHLPALRYFGCGGRSFIDEIALFRRLDISPRTTLLLRSHGEETADACQRIMRTVQMQLLHPSRTALRLETTLNTLFVQIYSPGSYLSNFHGGHDKIHQDGVAIEAGETPRSRILPALLDVVAPRITAVYMKRLEAPWSDDMTALLHLLEAVKELHVWNHTRHMLGALALNTPSKILFPSLKYLVINLAQCCSDSDIDGEHEAEYEEDSYEDDCDGEEWLSSLVPILQARAQAGMKLAKLVITGPLHCPGVIEVLRGEAAACVEVTDLVLQALRDCVGELHDERA